MIRDTLLIIDDSELDLAILNEIFKNLFRVECCLDARQGISFLHHHQERICGVLLDICLERRGAGFTVLHQLQGDPATSDLPVILITTDPNEKDVRSSVERGAVDFLVKPVDPHTVQERVCNVVRAAWPPQSTILDRKPEDEVQKAAKPARDTVHFFARDLTTEEIRQLSQRWLRKLEQLCRLRPVLSLENARQLGTLTTLLAQCYAEQNPGGGLTLEDAALIGLAAPFCDIGLLGLPDQIAAEGEVQEGSDADQYFQHTQLGYELFAQEEDIPFFRYAGEIALWHHKNIDGSGFPREAAGEAMPLSARLVRTALRIQHYLHFYQGYPDLYQRLLRALKSEVGIILAPDMYQTVEQGSEELRALFHAS